MRSDRILLAHGSGGTMMRELIDEVFVAGFDEAALGRLDDAASLDIPTGRLAFSTDTYVVTPRFFPGGDIGRLAVCGTVNDVATSGARPLYLSVGFVLEEGLLVEDLKRILVSMRDAAAEAGVHIVTGDTKVVEKGHGDGVYINTAGVGVLEEGVDLSGSYAKPGDKVLLSGTLGDHGIAIVSTREGLKFETDIESDAAPLNALVAAVLAAAPDTRCFRDPTRGGLASTLNEIAAASGVSITVTESDVPVNPQVRGASEMLGYDVFQVANEGKMVAIVPAGQAEAALAAMRSARYGEQAAIIGEVAETPAGKVYVKTPFGATRIMDMLVGEQLPRIC
jgi:hydrogenase expression/formation protein HypE